MYRFHDSSDVPDALDLQEFIKRGGPLEHLTKDQVTWKHVLAVRKRSRSLAHRRARNSDTGADEVRTFLDCQRILQPARCLQTICIRTYLHVTYLPHTSAAARVQNRQACID